MNKVGVKNSIIIGVYRRLDNRAEGLSDESPRALELHIRRKKALHSVFDGDANICVTDWGKTDDTGPHEYVELTLVAAASAAFHCAVVPALKWLGAKLAEKAVEAGVAELAKYAFAKLFKTQEAEATADFTIKLPDGTIIDVAPPDRNATITIKFADCAVQSINYVGHR